MTPSRLASRIAIPVYERLSGRRPWTELRRLRDLQWHTPDELEALALQSLRPLLRHAAAHVPYYRDLLGQARIRADDIRALADLSHLPLTGKTDLRSGFPDRVVASNLPASRRFRAATSGSSGIPLEFYMDRANVDRRLGSFLLFWEWAGVATGDGVARIIVSMRPAASVAGGSRWVRATRRIILGERTMVLSGVEARASDLLACVRRLPTRCPYLVWGFPSSIARLAAELLSGGGELPSPPRVVISTGETLTPVEVSTIARAFRCRVVNHYSSYEVLHLAQTCPENPELLHVDGERAILRVVREDGSAAALGESGRVVITDLGNWVMPFINYDIGDWAQAGPPCVCGRGFPTLLGLEGRLGEAIRTPAGKVVSPVVLGSFLVYGQGALPYVREFQALQHATDTVTLRIVPTARFTVAVARDLEHALGAFLGPDMHVTIETVDRIAPEASGKRLVVKSTLAHV